MTRLTIKNLQTAFGVSHMTISAWRKGTATRKPLPTSKRGGTLGNPGGVAFDVGPTEKWAIKNGIPILVPLADLVGQGIIKRGPKPKVEEVPPAKRGPMKAKQPQVAALLKPKAKSATVTATPKRKP